MIASIALLRVHVLVVELPGRTMLRLRAEAAVRARGWIVARDPEDADVVLVCGTPRVEIAEAVDALWARVPQPRARRTVRAADGLTDALDSAARVLADPALQRRAAAAAVVAPVRPPTRFGPVGPEWPAGLLIDCAIDGADRITAVGVRRIAVEEDQDDTDARDLVLAVAAAAGLLRLAGWPVPALRLDRVVDLVLAGRPPERLQRRLRGVRRSVRRSTTVRWALAQRVQELDVTARVLALLDTAIDGTAAAPPARVLVGRALAALPVLVAATEPLDA